MNKINNTLNRLIAEIVEVNDDNGWDKNIDLTEQLLLLHAEVSEAVEALREFNPPSSKIHFSSMEEELADTIIRILYISAKFDFNIVDALEDKIKYNKTREYRHGGKAF